MCSEKTIYNYIDACLFDIRNIDLPRKVKMCIRDRFKKVEAIELGNSYGVKQGDIVIAVGAPAGIVHSSDYGNISYVVRNVQTVDGNSRIFYTDANGDAGAGTFLLNISGCLLYTSRCV